MEPQRTILVCDDEAHIRHVIAHKLRGAGFTVREARSGQEGLDVVMADPPIHPDLIITDLQMPAVDGLEMCRQLRLHAPTAATPVLMLTARGYILKPEQLAQTNIREVISKPFGVKQLLDRVMGLLGPGDERRAA